MSQDWLQAEARQSSESGLPSRQLLHGFSSYRRGREAIVLWLRAIAGHHMLCTQEIDFITTSESEWAHDGEDTT